MWLVHRTTYLSRWLRCCYRNDDALEDKPETYSSVKLQLDQLPFSDQSKQRTCRLCYNRNVVYYCHSRKLIINGYLSGLQTRRSLHISLVKGQVFWHFCHCQFYCQKHFIMQNWQSKSRVYFSLPLSSSSTIYYWFHRSHMICALFSGRKKKKKIAFTYIQYWSIHTLNNVLYLFINLKADHNQGWFKAQPHLFIIYTISDSVFTALFLLFY